MNYELARTQVETGDLIAVRSVHGLMGRLTQFFTRSPYTHAGVALWAGGRLYMAELNGGRNHLVPLSQMAEFDVYARPEGVTIARAEAAIYQWLAYPVDYGFIAFVAIGLLDWFHIPIIIHWTKILVCSGYCVAIYETAGWSEHSRVISPRQLAAWLTLRFAVRVG